MKQPRLFFESGREIGKCLCTGRMISVERYPKVAAEFATYRAFLAENKIAVTNPIPLSRSSPNVAYIGRSDIRLGWSAFPCRLEIEKSPKATVKYALKIFARYFDDKPCFRFCSRGSVHVNAEIGDGLPARAVPTPHFHKIDTNGILIAFQTAALLDAEESAKVVASPRRGTNLFCHEANLFSDCGQIVVPEIMPDELDLSTDDPLSSAIFPRQ